MFQVTTENQSYLAEVRVDLPGDKGKAKTQVFIARFKRVSQDELDDIHARLAEGTLKDDPLIREILVGWKDVIDANGHELEFNEDNLTRVINVYPTRPTLIQVFFATINGAVRKN